MAEPARRLTARRLMARRLMARRLMARRLMARRLTARRLMARRLLLPLLAVAAVLGASPAHAQEPASGVVVLGVAGLRWDDVGPATPALQRLAREGAVGVLSVKALPAVTCAADGWLTLGAGARAQAYGAERDPCGPGLPADPEDARRNAATRDGARLGALTAALDGDVQTSGPGAVLAAGPGRRGPVTVVDLGALEETDRVAGLARVDAAVAEALAAPDVDLLLVGLAEGTGGDTAHLHVAMAAGPSFPRGALTSASTGRAPYVQLIDVAPTVLGLRGRGAPEVMDGQPWQVQGSAPSVAALADLDDRAVTGKASTVPFFVVLIAALLVLLVALRRRPRAQRAVALAGAAAPGASFLAMLVPWWRAPVPLLALLALVAGLSALAATTRRVGAVLGLTALVMAADLLAGAPLQLDAPAGYSPLVAGRFSGLGNVAFGVYGTAWLFAIAAAAAGRSVRTTAALVAGLGVVAVALDGAPQWGRDVGGVLALVPALVVLGLLLTGTRVSVLRLALAGLAGAAVVTAFALLDLARPAADRTHLGRFAADVRDGTAGELLVRKASAVLALLFHSPVTAALPLVVAGAVWLVARPPAPLRAAFVAVPALRSVLLALGVLSAVGFAVNDSGAAVPALALLVAVPAAVAVVAGVAGAHPGRRPP